MRAADFHLCRLGIPGRAYGTCNQLFVLINNILLALRARRKYLVVDDFLCEINRSETVPAGRVVDLDATSSELGLRLVDRSDLKCELVSAEYGLRGLRTVDVLGALRLPATITDMNVQFGVDPLPGFPKNLYVKFLLTPDLVVEEVFREGTRLELTDHAARGADWSAIYPAPLDYTAVDQDAFDSVLRRIRFHPRLTELVTRLVESRGITCAQAAHLRVESDAVRHWSERNGMPPGEFAAVLYRKYLDLFARYVDAGDQVHLMTCDAEDPLVRQLAGTYTTTFVDTRREIAALSLVGREVAAVVDLLIGSRASRLFIGCHDLRRRRGSTFSYAILRRLRPGTQCVLLDLDDIRSPETLATA